MWGWLLGRIDFQCWVLGKEKVENREKRGTAEHESTFWRKDKAKDWYCVYWVLEKVFYALMFFFFKYCVDVDNYGSLRGFGFI